MFGWLSLVIFRHFGNLTSFSPTVLLLIEWLMKWNCGRKKNNIICNFKFPFCANQSEFQPKNTWFQKFQFNWIAFHRGSIVHFFSALCTMHTLTFRMGAAPGLFTLPCPTTAPVTGISKPSRVHIRLNWIWNWIDWALALFVHVSF